MALTKVGPKYQVTIPKATREAAGLKVGDFVEAKAGRHGVVTLRPKAVIDKSYIDKRLREAEEDIKAGRVYGPFKSAKDMIRSLHKKAA
jgi:AbrB family looped-hinge helix DNA binding protein